MPIRHPLLQAVALIAAALVFAIVANGFASRTRKLMLPGYYPGATRVPPHETAKPATPAVRVATATVATASIAPPPPTATIAPAPVTTTTTSVPSVIPRASAESPAASTTKGSRAVARDDTPVTPAPAPPPAADALAKYAAHPSTAYVEISGDEAALLHGKGVLFLDARRSSVYAEGHIPGSRTFSVWESDIDEKVNGLFNERSDPREQNLPIVVYCSGGACEDSHMLAEKLWGIQFNNVYVYKDGFPDWQKRGLPVHTGAQP
jgi:rhodanese-related sulfurtransferase